MKTDSRARRPVPRPLTRTDLDQCIQRLAVQLGETSAAAADDDDDGSALRPRWISPAELVRLVGPLTGRN